MIVGAWPRCAAVIHIEFEEAAEADRHLAIIGVGKIEAAVEIGKECHAVCIVEIDAPGLGVVRVGREQRVREREAAWVLLARARRTPGFDGIDVRTARAMRQQRRGGEQAQDLAAGRHGDAP